MSSKSESNRHAYWWATLKLLGALLSIWFVVSFVCGILLVDLLNQVQFFGFKLGFWFAQQGAIYTFVVLIFIYAKKMESLDKKYKVEEE